MAMVASISLPPIEVSSSEAAALAARRDQRPNAIASFCPPSMSAAIFSAGVSAMRRKRRTRMSASFEAMSSSQ